MPNHTSSGARTHSAMNARPLRKGYSVPRLQLVLLACVGLLFSYVLVSCGSLYGRYISLCSASPFPATKTTAADAIQLHGSGGSAAAVELQKVVLPHVVGGSVITGVMSSELQSIVEDGWGEGAMWSMRGLLHGKRRPSRYSKCPECTLIACREGGGCSGHCKRGGQLFTCRSIGITGAFCSDEQSPDPETLPVDRLEPLVSAEVQATSPFIGCANITDTADGCPAAGTNGMLADGSDFTVRETQCNQHRYNLTCTNGPRPTPFFPFGFCLCLIESASAWGWPESEWRACRTTEIDVADLGVDISSDGPTPSDNIASVVSTENYTVSTFGVREPVDVRTYSFDISFRIDGEIVAIDMSISYAPVSSDDNVIAEAPIPGVADYEAVGPAPGA